jgi:formyl-CoA transferase
MLSRVKHRQALDAILREAFSTRSAAEWVEMLNAAGVACGPINTVDQVFADPQIQTANLVREVSNAAWGPHKVLALPVHLSRTPARVERAAPMTGEHTRDVLASLGYDVATLDALLADGVIEQYKGETT